MLSLAPGNIREPPAVVKQTPALHRGVYPGFTKPLCGVEVSLRFLTQRVEEFHTCSDIVGQDWEGSWFSVIHKGVGAFSQ